MAISLAQPLGLLGLAAVAVAVLVWMRDPPPLSRIRARLSLGLRVLILALLAFALAGLGAIRTPSAQALVVLADRSASVTSASDQEKAAIRQLATARGTADQMAMVTFGREAVVENPPDAGLAFTDFAATPNPNYTALEEALRLGSSLLPADLRHHLVVLSDGRQNIGDAVTEARLLRSQGTRVDVLPLQVLAGPDVRVDSVDVPAAVPPGTRVHARVQVASNVATSGVARVFLDRALVAELNPAYPSGPSTIDVTLPPAGPGFHDVRVEISPATDTYSENNVGEGLFQVLGAQRVLVVEGHPGAAANLVGALQAASMEPSVVGPGQVPTQPSGLAAYQAMALVDVPAGDLSPDRQQAIQAAVRDLGLGLAAFGGPDTFGPGGMAGTPVEAALPIDMQISDRVQKPPIAVVLVLESMEDSQADSVMRGAARAVVDKLTSKDYIGMTDSISNGLAVPLQQVKDKAALTKAIAGVQSFGDAGSYAPFIAAAADALAAQKTAVKHIIVLGDGDTQGDYATQVQALAAKGITVSSIGINVHGQAAMMDQMHAIARDGKGRFYQSNDPSQVPQLLLEETQKGLKPWIVEQRFKPAIDSPSSVLSGLDLAALPPLDGYVASTPKAAAEVILRSAQQDPVLAQWQYGLGRAVAWTSDIEGRWTHDMLASPQSGRLMANQVAWTLPLRDDPDLSLQVTSSGDSGHLIAQLRNAATDVTSIASVLAPDLTAVQVPLQLTAPGRYEGDFPADQVGSYVVKVTAGRQGRVEHSATAGLAMAYSPEFRFLGTDLPALQELARAGGGSVLGSAADAFKQVVPPTQVQVSLAALLLAIAVVLLPIDIALRRLVFRRADAELWTALVRRTEAAPAEVEATLGRLRGRMDRRRGATGLPVTPVTPDGERPPPVVAAMPTPRAPDPGGATPGPEVGAGLPPAEPGDLAARLLERRRRKER
ncbi:MAG: hypothetical protein QOK05_340 [Chloroflexota bacterium]|jgi:uncharacterized membrane protein|nr:hypothetical protein [Chloroflexota bacterium]